MKPLKIIHITDLHIRHAGRLFYSTGKKINNGLIKNGHNGLLVDFFDHQAIADQASRLLKDRKLAERLGAQARQDAVQHYSLKQCLPKQLDLIEKVAKKEIKRQDLFC